MKTFVKIIIGLIFLNIAIIGFSKRTLDITISGEWRFCGVSESEFVECPDILVLEENGSYKILNDCYGVDPINPIIETGDWSFNEKDNILKLINRDLSHGGGYTIWNKTNTQDFKVKLVDGNLIQLSYYSKEKQSDFLEIWKRNK